MEEALDFRGLAEKGYQAWKEHKPEAIAIDTETHGLSWYDRAFCGTVSWGGDILLTPLGVEGFYFELEYYDSRPILREILLGTERWVGHNIKFDCQKLLLSQTIAREEIFSDRIDDTWGMSVLLNELRPSHKLGDLAVSLLGIEDLVDVEMTGKNKGKFKKVPREDYELGKVRRKLKLRKEDGYGPLPREVVIPYAIKDTDHTLLLYNLLKPQLEEIPELWQLYRDEMEGLLVLLDVEGYGMGIDTEYLEGLQKEMGRSLLRDEEKLVKGSGIENFNPGSPQQVVEVVRARGHDVPNAQKEALMAIDDPWVQDYLAWKKDQKVYTTYVQGLLHETRDGIFHPNHLSFGTKTGRMSSSTKED